MTRSSIAGVEFRTLRPHVDPRGSLRELWRRSVQPVEVRQVVITMSVARALRGMHYHLRQNDILCVVTGRVFLALVDLRAEDPIPEHCWLDPSETVLIPAGVAHGYTAEEPALLTYLLTAEADGSDEHGFRYDDPGAGIEWPVRAPILSERDSGAGSFADALAHVRRETSA